MYQSRKIQINNVNMAIYKKHLEKFLRANESYNESVDTGDPR